MPSLSGYGPAVSSGVVTQPDTVFALDVPVLLSLTLVVAELEDEDTEVVGVVGDPPQRAANAALAKESSSSARRRLNVCVFIAVSLSTNAATRNVERFPKFRHQLFSPMENIVLNFGAVCCRSVARVRKIGDECRI